MKRKLKSGKSKRSASSAAKAARRPASPGRGLARGARYARPFPIVGIGASAGGFEAFSRLIDNLPANTGMAFVLVQHLAPRHASALTGLLSSHTKMPVVEVRDRMAIEPNHIYVIPPNMSMTVSRGLLHLMPRAELETHMPVDSFLQSLAQERQHQAIGVILSGTATDGTLGLKAIKAAGGLTFAQDERSARYEGMPRSAIASGAVDFVLPPEGIAKELARISRHPALNLVEAAAVEVIPQAEVTDLEKLFALLRARTGADFTYYKPATIRRRIQRRMLVRGVSSLRDYVRMLQQSQAECEALYEDILIHVTSFFRDPQVFEALKRTVFPVLVKNRPGNDPIRIWVPGCSTGEDAYSLIIALLEFLNQSAANGRFRVQAFATDISEKAIVAARHGLYSEAIASQVSPARLRRFFTKTERGYQISKAIRDAIVFAKHDVTRDPPYSRLDIVSCRNLLIFLEPVLQHRVLGAFHYSLKPHGYLVLGSSETVGERSAYFGALDRKRKIYVKQPGPAAPVVDLALRSPAPIDLPPPRATAENHPREFDLAREVDRIVIESYGPPGVLVNEDMEVLQFRGHTGPFLGPMPGAASLNLLKIAHRDLVFELRAAMQRAKKARAPIASPDVPVKRNGKTRRVNIRVLPVKSNAAGKPHFLVLFEAAVHPAPDQATRPAGAGAKVRQDVREMQRLERELGAAKEFARSAVEDQEAVNEELRAANEELLSTNEELQTTNEELETAKEELESANEELTTLNDELQNRNQELAQVGGDLRNILSTVYDGIVFVDPELRVRFFTPPAQKTLNLLPSDIGRSIGDIKPAIVVTDLDRMIADVVEGGPAKETEVSAAGGNWYSLRVRPYMNDHNKIEGAVVSLADITEARRAREVLAESERRFNFILDASPLVVFVKDAEGRYRYANPPFEKFAGLPREQIVGRTDREIFPPALAEILRFRDREIFELEAPVAFEETIPRDDGPHTNIVSKFPLRDREGKLYALCGIVTDITERKRAEEALEAANIELRQKALLIDLAHNPIIVRSLDGAIELWNTGAEKAYGWSKEEALGKAFAGLLHVEFPEPEERIRTTLLRDGRWEGDLIKTRRDGSKISVASTWVLHTDAQGQPVSILQIDRDITERRKAEEVEREMLLLQQLAQDEERQRISRDLHDTTGPSLAALIMQLSGVVESGNKLDPKGRKALHTSLSLAKQAADEIRTVAYQLHPPLLEESGLETAVRWYADSVRKLTGVKVNLEFSPGFGRLPKDAEIALFRMVQEALGNVHRHSGSKTATVALARTEDRVTLEIRDRGNGMPKDAVEGLGLRSIRQRVEHLKGKFAISSDKQGTILSVSFPVAK